LALDSRFLSNTIRLMFVELGSATDVWRAHVVRGILASHGIEAVIWHENAVHIYAPGWGPHCVLLVNEDDADDAMEVMRARPEPVSESDNIPMMTVAPDILPGFWALLLMGVCLCALFSLIELILYLLTHLSEHSKSHYSPPIRDSLAISPLDAPLSGVAWGVVAYLMFLPLRGVKDGSWMAMVAYLWLRVLLIALTLGLSLW
jgi:hypothetical protein